MVVVGKVVRLGMVKVEGGCDGMTGCRAIGLSGERGWIETCTESLCKLRRQELIDKRVGGADVDDKDFI